MSWNRKPINVLSLCDGIGSGMMALIAAGIPVANYYASEISEVAMRQSMLNYPEIIQLGDMRHWSCWHNIDWSSIDLILSGTPCQGFSLAGKQLGFVDNGSVLFFVFDEILNHARKYNKDVKFMMENVNMKKDYMDKITNFLQVSPVNINSNLVSGQNRNRWYWTNINGIEQPNDKGIKLSDVVDAWDDRYNLKTPVDQLYFRNTAKTAIDPDREIWCAASRGRTIDGVFGQRMEINATGRTNALTTVQKDNHVVLIKDGKPVKVRKLTGNECRKLQTIPESFQWDCSENQKITLCGHGWTIDVIAHILSYFK